MGEGFGALRNLDENVGYLGYAVGFLYYLVLYCLTFFFNTALVGATMIRLDGGDPTLSDGLEVAFNTAYVTDGLAVQIRAIPQWVTVAPSANAKCVRCWHHRADVGRDADHPELCGRCVDNVAGLGEQRHFA